MKKYFKTLDQQIEILEGQGLAIENREKVRLYLLRYNYYKVINSGADIFYEDKKRKKFIEGVNFQDLVEVHKFDVELKNILLMASLDIERHFRSIVSHVFMKNHQEANSYLDPENFNNNYKDLINTNIKYAEKIIEEYAEEINYSKSIKYYMGKYNHVPFWFLVNFYTFGKIINFYQTMKNTEKEEVCDYLSMFLRESMSSDLRIKPDLLESFLLNIKEIRNICAHDNLIIGYRCENDTKYLKPLHEYYGIDRKKPRRNVFNAIIIMQVFLDKNQFDDMIYNIKSSLTDLEKNINKTSFNKLLGALGIEEEYGKDRKI